MIENLLLPEKIKDYYLFSKRVIGFDIGTHYVHATQAYIRARNCTIEKVESRGFYPATTGTDFTQRTAQDIKSILQNMNSYDEIHTAISSSLVFFKELTLPFTTKEQLNLVLAYEIEPLLPFPLDQAVVDFIITKVNQGSADILVAAVRKQDLIHHVSLFQAAGVEASKVLVDLFAVYGLMQEIPAYASHKATQAIISLEFDQTRIGYLYNGKLKFVRTIPSGLDEVLKKVSSTTNMSYEQLHEHLMSHGFESQDTEVKALIDALHQHLMQVTFTLQSFSQRLAQGNVESCLLLGIGAEIKNIAPVCTTALNIPTALFDTSLQGSRISVKNGAHISPSTLISASTAIPSPANEDFNLRQKEFSLVDESLFTKQIIIIASVTLLIFGIFIGNSMLQTRKLQYAITRAERETISALNETLGLSERNLDQLVAQAQSKVQEQDRIWFSFSQQMRSSFLTALQKLSTQIDRDSIGLILKKARFTQEQIQLQGEVKNISALVIFENELKEADLGSFPEPQEPKFDITITLKKINKED